MYRSSRATIGHAVAVKGFCARKDEVQFHGLWLAVTEHSSKTERRLRRTWRCLRIAAVRLSGTLTCSQV